MVSAAAGLVGLGLVLAVAPTLALAAQDQPPGDPAAGRQVFEANCAMCHGPEARGMGGMHPSLRGAVQRLSRQGVVVTIREGRDTTPPMPAFDERLTDAQIADVTAYLASLPSSAPTSGAGRDRDGMMDGGMMDGGMMDGGMMDGGMMDGGWLTVLLTVLVAVLVLLVAAVIVWLVRGGRDGPGPPRPQSAARAELDRRYAAGELDREEYLQRREDLES